MSHKEKHQILFKFNNTDKDFPRDSTIHRLFREQAAKTPDNTALVFQGQELTYGELDRKSDQLASQIRKVYKERTGKKMPPDTLIPLCLERGLEMVVTILATLKAGGAYVPIDPTYPKERIDHIISDTKAEIVMSQRRLTENDHLQLPEAKLVLADLDQGLYADTFAPELNEYSRAQDLAYVIYTSGTTGKPKGVMVEHASICNLMNDLLGKYGIVSEERFLLFANYTFDASVEQISLPLFSGGTLFIIDNNSILDKNNFIGFVTKNQIDHLDATPSYLSSIKLPKLPALKRVVFGAEYLSKDLFMRYSKNIPMVINAYGPTEASITSLVSINSHLLNNARIQNIKAYVLDGNMLPVPIGVAGELHIAGAGLARGYLNDTELTRERFVPNPFATQADIEKGYDRMYRTGDMVRWLPDGNLEFIGRNDDQVKIRGFRIEIGEVEHALSKVPGIKQSCVIARESKTGAGKTKYLAGYYVTDGEHGEPNEDAILDSISKTLPDYMVPYVLVHMESFPLTINGKLDRKALPEPGLVSSEGYTAPSNEIETTLCGIYAEVLGLNRVGSTETHPIQNIKPVNY